MGKPTHLLAKSCKIYEILIWNTPLSDENVTKLDAVLRARYGQSLTIPDNKSNIGLQHLSDVTISNSGDPGNDNHYLGWNDTDNQWVNRLLSFSEISGTLSVSQGGTGATTFIGLLLGNGTSAVTALKSEFAKTDAPVAATDDTILGYVVGSRWIDTTNDKEYVCLDNTDGAAVWTETTVTEATKIPIDTDTNITYNENYNTQGKLVLSSTTEDGYLYDGTELRMFITKSLNYGLSYDTIVSVLSPTIRFLASDITGSAGSWVWPASIGGGSVNTQLSNGSTSSDSYGTYIDSAIGLELNIGSTINGSNGFTIIFVARDVVSSQTYKTFFSLHEVTESDSNLIWIQRGGSSILDVRGTNNFTGNYGAYADTVGVISTIITTYKHSTTHLRTVFNGTLYTDSTSATNWGDDVYNYITIGGKPTGLLAKTCKLYEILIWNTPLSDENVTKLDKVLRANYGHSITIPNNTANVSIQHLSDVTISNSGDPGNDNHYLGWNDTSNQWVNRQPAFTEVSGTLAVSQGGTGAATLTGLLLGNGTSAITALKSEFAKTAAPAAGTADTTLGYVVGSRWLNTTKDIEYVCLDNTDGAAIWKTTSEPVLIADTSTNIAARTGDPDYMMFFATDLNDIVVHVGSDVYKSIRGNATI